jgi:hypothetical protein
VRFELGFETLKGWERSNRERKVVPNPRSTVEEGPFPILLLAILPNDEFQYVLVGSKTRSGWNLKLDQLIEVGGSAAIYTAVGKCCDFEIDAGNDR